MPAANQPIMHDVEYYIRGGNHDVTEYDWDRYPAFADMHWGKKGRRKQEMSHFSSPGRLFPLRSRASRIIISCSALVVAAREGA
jgi:hypothetical protein